MTEELGDLQKRVLTEIVNRRLEDEEALVVNRLATILERDQTTVFKSVKILEEKRFIVSKQETNRGPRELEITHKGFFYTVKYCGIDFEGWLMKYYPKLVSSLISEIRNIVPKPENRRKVFESMALFALTNNLFDNMGAATIFTPGTYANQLATIDTLKTLIELRRNAPDAVNEKQLEKFLNSQKQSMKKALDESFTLNING